MLDLEPATLEVARLLDGVREDHLDAPTPCADTSVAALLDHLMGLSLAFTWAAHKTAPVLDRGAAPGPGRATAEHLDPDWRSVLPAGSASSPRPGATRRPGPARPRPAACGCRPSSWVSSPWTRW